MVKEIILNNTSIKVHRYEQRKVNDVHEISVGFEVTSEEYHDIATLLYEGTFDVSVPEKAYRSEERLGNIPLTCQFI